MGGFGVYPMKLFKKYREKKAEKKALVEDIALLEESAPEEVEADEVEVEEVVVVEEPILPPAAMHPELLGWTSEEDFTTAEENFGDDL